MPPASGQGVWAALSLLPRKRISWIRVWAVRIHSFESLPISLPDLWCLPHCRYEIRTGIGSLCRRYFLNFMLRPGSGRLALWSDLSRSLDQIYFLGLFVSLSCAPPGTSRGLAWANANPAKLPSGCSGAAGLKAGIRVLVLGPGLADRLQQKIYEADGLVIWVPMVSAWSRTPQVRR